MKLGTFPTISLGIISSVLSFVWCFINNKHAKDNIIIYLSNLG
jgi:hypothetical protein